MVGIPRPVRAVFFPDGHEIDDFGDALYHFDAGISTTIAARAELKVSYLYDYKNQPPPDVKKGDSALFAALLFKW